ncbi:MAG: hypothetical protein AB1705_09745 [Verrucomicrobiota bacterium]
MSNLLIWFWTAVIFASLAWYGFLLFYIAARGGKEIVQMTRVLRGRKEEEKFDK